MTDTNSPTIEDQIDFSQKQYENELQRLEASREKCRDLAAEIVALRRKQLKDLQAAARKARR